MSFPIRAWALGVVAAVAMLAPAAALAVDYPRPEPYLGDGRYSEYRDAVLAYLKSSPDAADAPRAALDLMIASSVLNDPSTALKMCRVVMLNYPDTVPAKFLVRQFRDVNDFMNLMFGIYLESVESPPPDFAKHFDGAMGAGLIRYGGFSGAADMLAFAAEMAREVGDTQLQTVALDTLAKAGNRGSEELAIANILMDDKTPLSQRVAKLHAMPNRTLAIRFERFLISRMSDTERQQPDVQRTVADDFLVQNRLSEALPVLDKLPGIEDDARLSFWRGMATASTGDDSRAATLMGQTAAKFPDDPWGKQAAQYKAIVADLDRTASADGEAMLSMALQIRRGLSRVEMNAVYQRDEHTTISLYCGIVAGEHFELCVSKNGTVEVAMRSSGSDSAYYYGSDIPGLTSDALLHQYAVQGLLVAPTLQWTGSSLQLSSNPILMRVPDDVTKTIDQMLQLQIFSNRDTLMEWLRDSVHSGRFPVSATGDDASARTYAWLTADAMRPGVSRVEYTFDQKNSWLTFSSGGFKVTSLRFSSGPLEFKPPTWPDVKQVKGEKVEQDVATTVYPAIQALFLGMKAAPATQPATAPAAAIPPAP